MNLGKYSVCYSLRPNDIRDCNLKVMVARNQLIRKIEHIFVLLSNNMYFCFCNGNQQLV
jgi:hypothetical protein